MSAIRPASSIIVAAIAAAFLACGSAFAQAIRVHDDRPVQTGLEGSALWYPHLAIHPSNPDHLLGAMVVTPLPDEAAASRTCASIVSFDGGVSWQRHDFPITWCGDPWVAITPDGQGVFTALGVDPKLPQQGRTGLVLYHSADGGQTWDEHPMGLGSGHDHQTVLVDGSSPEREPWLYVVSSRRTYAEHGSRRFSVFVARSRDGGRTFDPPVYIRPGNLMYKAERSVVLSDGTLIVSFVEPALGDGQTLLLRRRAWVTRSTDGGHSFSHPVFVNEACGPAPDQAFSLSALVADTSSGPFRNRLYFVCNQHGGGGILLSYSADLGETWSTRIPVQSAPVDTSVRRMLQATTVNKDGIVGVAWSDFSNPGDGCYDVFFAASLDGGETFLPEQRVTSATSCPNSAMRRWGEGGAYYGLVTDDRGRFRLLWSDAREGLFRLRSAIVEVHAHEARPR